MRSKVQTAQPKSSHQLKESCDHAIEVAGQFVGLASAGIAFVVGLVFSTNDSLGPWLVVWICVLFAISVLCGLMVRMGAVSDINKTGSCDVYDPSLRKIAFLQIILFGLGVVLVAAVTFDRAFGRSSAPENEPHWQRLGTGFSEGISGLAVVESDSGHTLLLAVHDNKNDRQKRLSLIERKPGKSARWKEVEWSSTLPAPDDRPPNDLEAICRIPQKEGEFIAATSAGRLYRFHFVPQSGEMKLLKAADLPAESRSPEIESFDLQKIAGKWIAVWAGRGDSDKPAELHWAQFNPETLLVEAHQASDALANETLRKAAVKAVWPQVHTRHISDLRLTQEGAVFGVATSDPGDTGPFASALYFFGYLTGSPLQFTPSSEPSRFYITRQHKIEAVEFLPGPSGGVILASDDENAGGAVFFAN
jgi:hypothetical protein